MHDCLFLLLCWLLTTAISAQNVSERVFEDATGKLRYFTDLEQNRIPDFSHAGYRNGEVEVPAVPTVMTLSPVAGDNTAHIQVALDAVGAMTPDTNGIRGALLLGPGSYDVSGVLRMPISGVVLRGSGQGADPITNTVINGTGVDPGDRRLIILGDAGATNWNRAVMGTRTDITSPYVPVGSRTLEVAAADNFRVGDNVVVFHPSTEAWLAAINFGDVANDEAGPWRPGQIDLYYNRFVTAVDIQENKVTLDAPIFDHLDRSLSQAQLYVYDNVDVRNHLGVENLRIDVASVGPLELGHVRTCIMMDGVDNSWVSDVTGLNFSYALVNHQEATRTSVLRCSALSPHSPIEGGLRYNFAVNRQSNNILFQDCFGTEGRHTFVANGASQSAGIVWTDGESERDYSVSEGHRRWSQGLLFDNITFRDPIPGDAPLLALWNRGNFGTGHGWSSVHSVGWNVRTPPGRMIAIQKPPLRQNYGIGCGDEVSGEGPFDQPAGFFELVNQTPAIPSLYGAQLEQRLIFGVAPDGPARLTVVKTDTVNTLSWLDIAAAEAGYAVEFSVDGGSTFSEIATLPPNSTTYGHLNPPDLNVSLIYRVYATGNLPSAYSNWAREIDVKAEGAEYFDGTTTAVGTGGLAAQASTFTLDEVCETFKIEVTDPVNNPAPGGNAYIVRLRDGEGNIATDYTGQVNATFRVRSAGSVSLQVLFRSGEGSSSERTVAKVAEIPCDLSHWTEATFTFEAADFGENFDPSNIRDLWFYLDRGQENFGGNAFYLDHLVAGGPVAEDLNSPCDVSGDGPAPLIAERFDDAVDLISRNTDAAMTTDFEWEADCERMRLSVTNPVGNPLPPFSGYVMELYGHEGNQGIDLSACVRATFRVWSATTVRLESEFLSGSGDIDQRTQRLSQEIEGGGAEWTEVSFRFSPEDFGGFDPSDARGLRFFLDRGAPNFSGNDFRIDDIVIGGVRDTAFDSPCTGITSSNDPVADPEERFLLYPTLTGGRLNWTGPYQIPYRIIDNLGRVVAHGSTRNVIDVGSLNAGLYRLMAGRRLYPFVRR